MASSTQHIQFVDSLPTNGISTSTEKARRTFSIKSHAMRQVHRRQRHKSQVHDDAPCSTLQPVTTDTVSSVCENTEFDQQSHRNTGLAPPRTCKISLLPSLRLPEHGKSIDERRLLAHANMLCLPLTFSQSVKLKQWTSGFQLWGALLRTLKDVSDAALDSWIWLWTMTW